MAELRGEIRLAAVPRPVVGGTLVIQLADVSRADAAAEVVAEMTLTGVSLGSVDDRVGFALQVPELDPGRTYTIEAHLDADGSGDVSLGDYRTMEHFGVTPESLGGVQKIRLRRVV